MRRAAAVTHHRVPPPLPYRLPTTITRCWPERPHAACARRPASSSTCNLWLASPPTVAASALASLGLANGWSGVILHGYVRDVRALANIGIGVHAIGAVLTRTRFMPGSWLFADEDGIVVCSQNHAAISTVAPFF